MYPAFYKQAMFWDVFFLETPPQPLPEGSYWSSEVPTTHYLDVSQWGSFRLGNQALLLRSRIYI